MTLFTKERNGNLRILTIFGFRFRYSKKPILRWILPKYWQPDRGSKSFARMLREARIDPKYESVFEKIESGNLCIDCGCNAGAITDVFLAKGARVHAFEPHPYLYELLCNKYEANPDVQLYNLAVWDRDTEMDFYVERDRRRTINLEGTSLFERRDTTVEARFKVQVINLLDYIKDLGSRVYILKIDIEGAEFEILEKLLETGQHQDIDHIFCETHPHFFHDGAKRLRQIEERISEAGITNIKLDWA